MKHYPDQTAGIKNGAGYPVLLANTDNTLAQVWVAPSSITEKDGAQIDVAAFGRFPAVREFRLFSLNGGFFGYRSIESTQGAARAQDSVYGPVAGVIFDNEKTATEYMQRQVANLSNAPGWAKKK